MKKGKNITFKLKNQNQKSQKYDRNLNRNFKITLMFLFKIWKTPYVGKNNLYNNNANVCLSVRVCVCVCVYETIRRVG